MSLGTDESAQPPATRLATWIRRLRAAAAATLGPRMGLDDDPATFRDERGHRRSVDRPFLAWRLGTTEPPRSAAGGASAAADVLLWTAVSRPSVGLDGLPPGVDLAGTGTPRPLVEQSPSDTIEVWTETELCCLHALWRLADARGGTPGALDAAALRRRCFEAARWHVDALQPDNATNHPWAVQVFIAAACGADPGTDPAFAAGAEMSAQTLLHNCQINLGRADRFSAHILADAADALQVLPGPDRRG